MTNEQIAKMVSEHCYKPARNEKEFAFQLFVEKTVLPKGADGYTQQMLEELVFNHMESVTAK